MRSMEEIVNDFKKETNVRKVSFEQYMKDAENGKETLYINEDRTLEFARVIRYDKKGQTLYSGYLLMYIWECDEPDFIMSDNTTKFYKIW